MLSFTFDPFDPFALCSSIFRVKTLKSLTKTESIRLTITTDINALQSQDMDGCVAHVFNICLLENILGFFEQL